MMDQAAIGTPNPQAVSQLDHPSDDGEAVIVSTTSQSPTSPPSEQNVPGAEASFAYYAYPSAPVYPTAAAVYSGHSYYYPPPLPYATAAPLPYAITYWYPTPPIVTPLYVAGDGTIPVPAYYTSVPASAVAAPLIPTSSDDETFNVSGTVFVPEKEDGLASIPPLMTTQAGAPTPARAPTERPWLQRDDRKLRALVRRLGADKMEEVASRLSGWTVDDCRSRWKSMTRPRRPWTDDEDRRLRELVPKYSSVDHNDEVAIDWMLVSKVIKSRLPTHCQERWNELLAQELLAQGIEPIPHPVLSSSEKNSTAKHAKNEKRVEAGESGVDKEGIRSENVRSRGRSRVPQAQIATIQAIVTGKLQSNRTPRKRKARVDDGEGSATQRRTRRSSKL
jgi:Myb-like DNA-binding domain